MNDHQKHTDFLRQCILYDESAKRQELADGICRIQREMRCVRRALWLMVMLTALVVAGLGCGMIVVDNFPDNMPQSVLNIICSFGLGSLFSILGFIALWIVYHKRLNHQREECRQLVTKLLESRLGKPNSIDLRTYRAGQGSAVRSANDVNDPSKNTESTAGE